MGCKAFFKKMGKTQDAPKPSTDDTHNTVERQSPSFSSSENDCQFPARLRVMQGGTAPPVKTKAQVLAQRPLANPTKASTKLRGWRLSKTAPFLKRKDRKHLSVKEALEQIHASSSPFVSPPKISKVPASVQTLRQHPLEVTKKPSKPVIHDDSALESASLESGTVDCTSDLPSTDGHFTERSTASALPREESSLTTIEEQIVWISEAAANFLDPGARPTALGLAEGDHPSHNATVVDFGIDAGQFEASTGSSNDSSDTTASPLQAGQVPTPFTPVDLGNQRADSEQCSPLGTVSEDEGEEALGTVPESPCPAPGSQMMAIRTTYEASPIEEEPHHDYRAEVQHLQEEMSQKEALNQGLRLQLVDREDEVEKLREQLRDVQRERDMYEAEEGASAEEMQELRKELTVKDRQLSEQSAKATEAARHLQAIQNSVDVGSSQLIAERDRAYQHAQAQFHRAQTLQAMANAAGAERNNLAQRMAQMEAMANTANQRHQAEVMELQARLEQFRGAGLLLEKQAIELAGLKDKAEARIAELEVRVESLVQDVTEKWLAIPEEEDDDDEKEVRRVNPSTLKPNELRDARQAFEISQARLEAAAEANQELHDVAKRREKELKELRENNEQLQTRAARLSSTFEIWRRKLENWTETLPGIAKMKEGIEEDPGLKELLEESVFHERSLGMDLKQKADRISVLEATLLKLRRAHGNEVEALEQQAEKLQEQKIRIDAEHYEMTCHLKDAQEETERLKEQLAQSEGMTQQWKEQCMEQAYGDTATVIERQHKYAMKQLEDRVEAILHRCDQCFRAKGAVEGELGMLKWVVGERLAGLSDLEAERDWYREQVDALRERFAHELLLRPLEIPFTPALSGLSEEQKEEVMAAQNGVIARLTGYAPIRADARPRNVQATEVWEDFIAWVLGKGEDGGDGKGKGRAGGESEAPTMSPLPPAVPQQSQGAEDSSWVTEDDCEEGHSNSEA